MISEKYVRSNQELVPMNFVNRLKLKSSKFHMLFKLKRKILLYLPFDHQ